MFDGKLRPRYNLHPDESYTEVTVKVPDAYLGYFVDKCPHETSHDHVERGYDIRPWPEEPPPILTIDFDGVLHKFTSPWQGIHIISDGPVNGAIERLYEYVEHFRVYILSLRSHEPSGILAMKQWLGNYDRLHRKTLEKLELPDYKLLDKVHFPPYDKPPSHVSIDDRGLPFNGDWNNTIYNVENIKSFVPWNNAEK